MKTNRIQIIGSLIFCLAIQPGFISCQKKNVNIITAVFDQDSINKVTNLWVKTFQEFQINLLLDSISNFNQPNNYVINNVNVVNSEIEKTTLHSVFIKNGTITDIDNSGSINLSEFNIINGSEKYLIPGLVDMHTHQLQSEVLHLLNLVNGVTSVRNMAGTPWILEQITQIKNNKLLAPNLYSTGPIITERNMPIYGAQVKTISDADSVVKSHKKQGFQFIKIHNNLSKPLFNQVFASANALNIPVVGHVPHDTQLQLMVDKNALTIEHFKGYILDGPGELTDEDYVTITENSDVWLCPTFYTVRMGLREERATEYMKSKEVKYVPYQDIVEWKLEAKSGGEDRPLESFEIQKEIFRNLLGGKNRFLVGTDCGGGYSFMVAGFAVHSEMKIMQELGMPIKDVLTAATINASLALLDDKQFGMVEPGKRADLVLLNQNPLKSLDAFEDIEGVMVRGIWLERNQIDHILNRIEKIYRKPEIEIQPTKDNILGIIDGYVKLTKNGYILRKRELSRLVQLSEILEMDDALTKLSVVGISAY